MRPFMTSRRAILGNSQISIASHVSFAVVEDRLQNQAEVVHPLLLQQARRLHATLAISVPNSQSARSLRVFTANLTDPVLLGSRGLVLPGWFCSLCPLLVRS